MNWPLIVVVPVLIFKVTGSIVASVGPNVRMVSCVTMVSATSTVPQDNQHVVALVLIRKATLTTVGLVERNVRVEKSAPAEDALVLLDSPIAVVFVEIHGSISIIVVVVIRSVLLVSCAPTVVV